MTHPSDRQLAHSFLANLRGVTTLVVLVMGAIAISVSNQGLFDAFFADETLENLGFHVDQPWRYFGANWLSSLVIHDGFGHFAGNFPWLLGFGLWIEHRKGLKRLTLVSLSGHICALGVSVIIHSFGMIPGSIQGKTHLLVGASAAGLAMIGYTIYETKSYVLGGLGAAIAVFLAIDANISAVAHLAAMASGLAIGYILRDRHLVQSAE